jgi:hypothetical protein
LNSNGPLPQILFSQGAPGGIKAVATERALIASQAGRDLITFLLLLATTPTTGNPKSLWKSLWKLLVYIYQSLT